VLPHELASFHYEEWAVNETPRRNEESEGTVQPTDPLRRDDEELEGTGVEAQGDTDEDEMEDEEIEGEAGPDEDEDSRQ
jgi:hypothetical protein